METYANCTGGGKAYSILPGARSPDPGAAHRSTINTQIARLERCFPSTRKRPIPLHERAPPEHRLVHRYPAKDRLQLAAKTLRQPQWS